MRDTLVLIFHQSERRAWERIDLMKNKYLSHNHFCPSPIPISQTDPNQVWAGKEVLHPPSPPLVCRKTSAMVCAASQLYVCGLYLAHLGPLQGM